MPDLIELEDRWTFGAEGVDRLDQVNVTTGQVLLTRTWPAGKAPVMFVNPQAGIRSPAAAGIAWAVRRYAEPSGSSPL